MNPTIEQNWARERNLNKGKLIGARTLMRQIADTKSTTPYEIGLLHDIGDLFDMILTAWELRGHSSKTIYRKEGKAE